MPGNAVRQRPSLPWRIASSAVMGLTCAASRGFLYGLNSVEVIGLERFLAVLDRRKDVEARRQGLITGAFAFFRPSNGAVDGARVLLMRACSVESRRSVRYVLRLT